jgi:hypothetical protein
VDGCILRDFSGATVGGPFTVENIEYSPGYFYQRVLWDAQRNWYLPGVYGQFQMVNPDGQSSAFATILWYEESAVLMAQMSARGVRIAEESDEGAAVPAPVYGNDPIHHPDPLPRPPEVQPLVMARSAEETEPVEPVEPAAPRKPRGGKERVAARRERARQERERRLPPVEEPDGDAE